VSSYRGRERCNDFSVGIELEGADDVPYEPAQYAALAQLVQALRVAYATLAAAPIVGHSDIAPGRKTDPGPAFDWVLCRRMCVA
jgi:N-acetyl-anhydromuramoyl-L-alanine amidase